MRRLRIGILGKRGAAHAAGFRAHPHAEVSALCDADPVALAREGDALGVERRFLNLEPMLDHVDAVFVATPMHLHAGQALIALTAGKHVLSEVTACVSLEECWALVQAVRASGLTYTMAENYLYFEENLIVREMAQQGLFGKPYFGEGEYVHDVKAYHHFPNGRPTWRTQWQVGKRGNTYPTHSLGPPVSWFEAAGEGTRPESIVCWGSGIHTDPEHPHDDTTETLVRLSGGGLIRLRLDMMSNRPPEEAFYGLQGTHGVYEAGRGQRGGGQVWVGDNPPPGPVREVSRAWKPIAEYADLVPTPLRALQSEAKGAGHGGGDFMVAYAFVQAVLGEAANPVDVVQAVEWTAVGLCSTVSIENGGTPVALPDFRK